MVNIAVPMIGPAGRRARDRDLRIGCLPTGPLDAITDVEGVRVGHCTLIEGDRTRTGATAILPQDGNLFAQKVPAALDVLNGYGKFAGATQIAELGTFETPVLLTDTLATGRAVDALIAHTLAHPENARVTSINAVVGETDDGRLNDIRAPRPSVAEMRRAIDATGEAIPNSPLMASRRDGFDARTGQPSHVDAVVVP